ncbi:hypothetical protein JW948_00940 [bacterium]|nr:hypothetical protein [bacterium]
MEKMKADPAYRKRVFIRGGIMLVAALAIIQWVLPKFSGLLMESNPSYAFIFLEILIFAILVLLILNWISVLRVGIQCVQQRRYPPKDVPVLIDVTVQTDQKAVFRGYWVIAAALIAIFLCIYLFITLAMVVVRMFP